MTPDIPRDFISHLQDKLGKDNVLTDPAECLVYGYDNSRRQGNAQVVTFAENTADVQQLVQLCHQYEIPLTVRGRGTGTPGGAVPLQGGVVLSLERMNQIIKVDPDNRVMVVEPGVTNQEVQHAAANVGFFWAPDPSSAAYCTVGGNLAYNSAGPRAVKYGATRENTLGLQAVTATGEIIRTGTYTTKGAVGYDLTRLLIGSEGTLAIITEAILKLTPLPEAKKTLQVVYQDIRSAAQATAAIMGQPIIPCALEFMDTKALELVRSQGVDVTESAGAMLIIEIDGLASTLTASAERVIQAAQNAGLISLRVAKDTVEAEQLWQARKALSPALRTIAPGKINEDVVVPVAAISELLTKLEELSRRYQITIVNFGHAGNGNIHVNLLFDPQDSAQADRAKECLSEVFKSVLALNGTLSGEHGIGIEKRDFMSLAIDATTLQLMRSIKKTFDPKGILNPGKIFPVEVI